MENTGSVDSKTRAGDGSLVGGRYRLIRRLDDLGQASVYEAEQLPVGRRVALKVIEGEVAAAGRERLIQAARLASRVRHPNVAAVYDVGPEADRGYVAMELCRGRSLLNLVQMSGALDVTAAASVGEQMLSGLAAAHGLGVLHGAIRPRYVMVQEETGSVDVKVIGFGLASLSELDDDWDRGFCAPELLQGGQPDVASDLYSVAAVLCFALSGTLPWDAAEDLSERRWFEQRLRAVLAPLEATEAWVSFFAAALAYDRDQRFGSADEMLVALLQAESGDWAEQSLVMAAQQLVGPYRLLRQLARGGMGELHLARAAVRGISGRIVALKRIRPELASNEDFQRRFLAEVSVAQRLSHPNIAQVFDVGKDGSQLFMAMEYVVGRDVRRILDRAREDGIVLPRDLSLFIARDVCEALAYAHRVRLDGRSGFCHGDVSPENVVVSYEGDVKLIDFGVGMRQGGVVMGKDSYVAPEAVSGGATGPMADIYSVGVLLLELLTGRRPADQGRYGLSASLQELLGQSERSILGKALAVKPEDRYHSAAAMRDELSVALSHINPRMSRDRLGRFVRSLFLAEYQADVALAQGLETDMPQDPGGKNPTRAVMPENRGASAAAPGSDQWSDETVKAEALSEADTLGFAVGKTVSMPASDGNGPAASDAAALDATDSRFVARVVARWHWVVVAVAALGGAVIGWITAGG